MRTGRSTPSTPCGARRQSTKLNGVSYPVQRAAAAVYTPEGKKETRGLSDYYLGNARLVRQKMDALGFSCMGGDNSPYVWARVGGDSWSFFDRLLAKGRRGRSRRAAASAGAEKATSA